MSKAIILPMRHNNWETAQDRI